MRTSLWRDGSPLETPPRNTMSCDFFFFFLTSLSVMPVGRSRDSDNITSYFDGAKMVAAVERPVWRCGAIAQFSYSSMISTTMLSWFYDSVVAVIRSTLSPENEKKRSLHATGEKVHTQQVICTRRHSDEETWPLLTRASPRQLFQNYLQHN